MESKDLQCSPTWRQMSREIDRDFSNGIPFPDILMMNVAIKQRTLDPYKEHRYRLDRLLWRDDPHPKTIIELGAGYGAMATMWPENSVVFNVDLPEMLSIQRSYLVNDLGAIELGKDGGIFTGGQLNNGVTIQLIPFTEADSLPFDNAYFFSVWALTETNLETWNYYIERATWFAGIYAVGWQGWTDIPGKRWPWKKLRSKFKTVRVDLSTYTNCDGEQTSSVELAAVNR